MAAPASYEDTVRLHLRAFYVWLGGLRVDYGGPSDFPDGFPFKNSYPTRQNFPILRTLATRERQFASVVDLLVATNWINSGTAEEIRQKAGDFAVLPLPVVVIEKGDFEIDTLSASVPKRFNRSLFNQQTLLWENHPWPGTYWLPIRATFWCNKRYTETFMQEWVMSQLGKKGAADKEVLIPVQHRAPWGQQWQALQLDGVSDLSELEGERERQIRYEMTFRMRMLHFRPNIETAEQVNSASVSVSLAQLGDNSEVDPFTRDPDITDTTGQSDNLYEQYYFGKEIDGHWPRAGAPVISASTVAPTDVPVRTVIKATVRTIADRVGVANRPVFIDSVAPSNVALISVGMRYRASAEVGLKLFQRPGTDNPPAWVLAREVVLPATTQWVDFQFFTLIDNPIFSLIFEGRAISSTLHFADVSVRHVYSGPRIAPTGNSSGLGGSTKHTWNGLPRHQSYLVVVQPSAFTGTWSLRLEDDENSPDHVVTRLFDATANRGYVERIQPKNGSIALSLPAGFTASTIFLQPYAGSIRPRL